MRYSPKIPLLILRFRKMIIRKPYWLFLFPSFSLSLSLSAFLSLPPFFPSLSFLLSFSLSFFPSFPVCFALPKPELGANFKNQKSAHNPPDFWLLLKTAWEIPTWSRSGCRAGCSLQARPCAAACPGPQGSASSPIRAVRGGPH